MKRAILLVDHGSRRPESNTRLRQIADALRDRLGDIAIVESAHMELAEPSIATGISRCVDAGADAISVCPYFLGPGRHTHEDIPRLVEDAAAGHPGIDIRIREPLGMASGFVDAIERWVAENE